MYEAGEFVLIHVNGLDRVAYLKSQSDNDHFDVDWYASASDFLLSPNENLSAFGHRELLHIVDQSLPSIISKANITRKCHVTVLQSGEVPSYGEPEPRNPFVRCSLKGTILSPKMLGSPTPSFPRDRGLNPRSTDLSPMRGRAYKKNVRVSFVGAYNDDDSADLDGLPPHNLAETITSPRRPFLSTGRLNIPRAASQPPRLDFGAQRPHVKSEIFDEAPPAARTLKAEALEARQESPSTAYPPSAGRSQRETRESPSTAYPPSAGRSQRETREAADSASHTPSSAARRTPATSETPEPGGWERRTRKGSFTHTPASATRTPATAESPASARSSDRVRTRADGAFRTPTSAPKRTPTRALSGRASKTSAMAAIQAGLLAEATSPLALEAEQSSKTIGSAKRRMGEVMVERSSLGEASAAKKTPVSGKSPRPTSSAGSGKRTRAGSSSHTPKRTPTATESPKPRDPPSSGKRTRSGLGRADSSSRTPASAARATPKRETPKSMDTEGRTRRTQSSSRTPASAARTPAVGESPNFRTPNGRASKSNALVAIRVGLLAERSPLPLPSPPDSPQAVKKDRRSAGSARPRMGESSAVTAERPSLGRKEESASSPAGADAAEAPFKRSSRSCKTAALKAMLSADEASVLVTHSLPAWSPHPARRKLVGLRRSRTPSDEPRESPLQRLRRMQMAGSAGRRDLNSRLADFRRAHRRTDADSDSDADSVYVPSSGSDADSGSDWEEAAGRKRRGLPASHRTASSAAKRRRAVDSTEESLALPARSDFGTLPSGGDGPDTRGTPGGTRRTPGRRAKPGAALEEARLRLHVSAVAGADAGRALTCREEEFADVLRFVSQRLNAAGPGADGGGCMYISGLPGTGKSATVAAVVAALRAEACSDRFDLVEVNGMRVTDPQQVYVLVLRQLTGERCTARHAAQLLDKEFKKRDRRPCLMIVDELDLLCTRRQQVLYNLFDWPQRAAARLTVLAIANTMDLPERLLHQRVASRLGLTRLVFQPYTHRQLRTIVAERLKGLDCFQAEALELTARKVAAISGDARRALDICRRAAELVGPAAKGGPQRVGLREVDQAIREMFASSKVRAITECSVYEQLLLRAVMAELARTGLEEAQLDRCVRQMDAVCRCEGLPLLTGGEVFTVVVRLASHKLLLCEHFRQDGKMKVRLNCSQHDVTFALKDVKYDNVLVQS